MFPGVPRAAVEAALPAFTEHELAPGDELSGSGRALFLVIFGALDLHWEGHLVARCRPGALTGEIALFDGEWRDTVARATEPTAVLGLDLAGYDALRQAGNPVAWHLEQRALGQLCTRIRTVADRVAEEARGKLIVPTNPGDEAVGHPIPASQRRVRDVLVGSQAFADATPETLDWLAGKVTPRRYRGGDVLLGAGSTGGGVYVVASGQVEVVVPSARTGAAPIASLDPGELAGVPSAVDNDVRVLEYTCDGDVVGLEIDHAHVARLLERPDRVGSDVRVASIRSVASLIVRASGIWTLATLLARRPATR